MTKLKPNQFILDGHTFSEIPLLFQTEMVQAVLEGRKTQTRRTRGLSLNVNGLPKKDWEYTRCFLGADPKDNLVWMADARHIPTKGGYGDICPYGKPGDLLWVRETWMNLMHYDRDGDYGYKADLTDNAEKLKWKPSIHMPKAAARLWLMVEEIRAERLQDITEEDAVAEGVKRFESNSAFFMSGYIDYNSKEVFAPVYHSSIPSFQSLWKSINGPESWNQNPWVWVVKFRVLSKTGRPTDQVILENWKEVNGG